MVAILDCGTTNTKCYLVEADGTLLAEKYENFGVKDNALAAEREHYREMLKKIVQEAVLESGRQEEKLQHVIGFGMITSDLGLLELRHMDTPAGLSELQNGVWVWEDTELFGKGIPFSLVRGIRNALAQERCLENVLTCDFMRGEETQVMGILKKYQPGEACNVIILSSHFKIIHVSADGKILQSMTTMSGQIFDCLLNHTVIGKSVRPSAEDKARGTMSLDEILSLAEEITEKKGLSRAFFTPRFMEMYTDMTAYERLLYLDAVIGLEDFKCMEEYRGDGPYRAGLYYLVGQEEWCQIVEAILQKKCPGIRTQILPGKTNSRDISIAGALAIAKKKAGGDYEF